ncbi:unnamed protein product, partial [Mesorhabditis belari]|uniref:Sulfotransferase n=1 Tax=Mesorhabditis belari TaxID=2138241 RepID=A0AAF3FDZ4_9BILA
MLLALKRRCVDEKCPILAPLQKFSPAVRISKKREILMCPIEKVMSTKLIGLTCFLEHPESYNWNMSLYANEDYNHRKCDSGHEISELKPYSTFRKVTIVREPLDRFVSGFVHLCL